MRYIPKEITFHFGIPEKIDPIFGKCYRISVHDSENLVAKKDQIKRIKNIIRMTERYQEKSCKGTEIQSFEMPNDPISNIRLQKRSSKYDSIVQCMILNKFIIDLDIETLEDAIHTDGIDPGGILRGEYIFGATSQRVYLIKVGSPTYEKMQSGKNRKGMKNIKTSELKPGKKYYSIGGREFYYIGPISGCNVSMDLSKLTNTEIKIGHGPTINYENPVHKYHLWMVPYGDRKTPEEMMNSPRPWDYISSLKSNSVVEEEECNDLPSIEEIRTKCRERLDGYLKELDTSISNISNYLPYRNSAIIFSMVPYGQKLEYWSSVIELPFSLE